MRIQDHQLILDSGSPCRFVQSPNCSPGIEPRFLVMHYTAGVSAEGAVAWLANPASKASAHFVIARDGAVTQLVRLDMRAWHAGKSAWAGLTNLNRHSIGIELVNAGKLRQRGDGAWLTWTGAIIPPEELVVLTHKHESAPAGWHAYTPAQLEAAAQVAAALHRAHAYEDVLGHDDIAPARKTDPGPAFPMARFRERVLGVSAGGPVC